MGRKKREVSAYRFNLKLDRDRDTDLVSWLESLPVGNRSHSVREMLRVGLRQPTRWEPVDIEEMRRMVAEELGKVLAGRAVASETTAPIDVDVEKKYGAKLDRMLGGLAAGHTDKDGG
jgi:hypothetical protein